MKGSAKLEKITSFFVKMLEYQNKSYPIFKIEFISTWFPRLKIEIDQGPLITDGWNSNEMLILPTDIM